MKNKVFAVLTVIILCLCFALPASAANTHVFDSTQTMSVDDVNALEQLAQGIEDKYGYNVILSIVDKVGDEGTYGYNEDLYLSNAKGENGIALTYNYGDNKYAFYCEGDAKALFTEDVQTNTLWNAFAHSETYYDGAYAYFVAVDTYLGKNLVVAPTQNNTTTQITQGTTQFVPTDRKLPLVADNADVLTAAEETDLQAKLEALGGKYDLEIGAVTVDSYEGKDPQAFADDFYDYNGYGYGENDDGIIVVFNTGEGDGNRNIAISTHGTGIDLLTDNEISIIIEMMIDPVKNGDFAGAFDNFVLECENAIDPSISIIWIPVSILIGFGLAFLIVKLQASKLKTVIQKADAADYVGNVMLTSQYDNFMYKNVTSSPKAESSSGGSTHTSSSGRTHGGGNKSF